jgi:hypothetical protein
MNLDRTILSKGLQYLATGGASGLASFVMEKLEQGKRWPHFEKMSSEVKMYAGYAVTGFFGIAAYFAMMVLLYVPVPQGYVEWTETLVAVAFTAAGVAQIYHRAKSFRKARKA